MPTGLRETLPKLPTVNRDEAANMVAAGKLRNEADGCIRYLPTLPVFPEEYRKTGPATGLPEIL